MKQSRHPGVRAGISRNNNIKIQLSSDMVRKLDWANARLYADFRATASNPALVVKPKPPGQSGRRLRRARTKARRFEVMVPIQTDLQPAPLDTLNIKRTGHELVVEIPDELILRGTVGEQLSLPLITPDPSTQNFDSSPDDRTVQVLERLHHALNGSNEDNWRQMWTSKIKEYRGKMGASVDGNGI